MIEASEFLDSVRMMEVKIQMKARQLQHLRDTATNTTAPMDRELVTHTKNVGAMGDTVAMIIDMEAEIKLLKGVVDARRKEILWLLDQLNPEDASILSYVYVERISTKDLCRELFLSRRQVQRRLKDALKAFQAVLNQHQDNRLTD